MRAHFSGRRSDRRHRRPSRGSRWPPPRRRSTMLQRSMSKAYLNHATLSDADLLREVHRLAGGEREATAKLIAVLAELDARRLYLAEGCASLFTYCTQVLHLSEHAAYGRIEAARAARRWPIVLELLADGSLHLTAVALLSRHLTTENHRDLLSAARHKSKREIEEIVAALRSQPAARSSIRKLPSTQPATTVPDWLTPGDAQDSTAQCVRTQTELPPPPVQRPSRHVEIRPLAPERYRVQFTASRETYNKLRRAQELLRHRIPDGDIALIVDRALTLLLSELRRTKHGATQRPRGGALRSTGGRHIPAAVKRAVWARDGGQCAFLGAAGRCTERGFLEYHHVVPFADGGAAVVDNIELRCRAHNAYEAARWLGVGEADFVSERRGALSSATLRPRGANQRSRRRVRVQRSARLRGESPSGSVGLHPGDGCSVPSAMFFVNPALPAVGSAVLQSGDAWMPVSFAGSSPASSRRVRSSPTTSSWHFSTSIPRIRATRSCCRADMLSRSRS